MKKKIFIFIAMLATLVCLFAVTAFAAEPDTTRETFELSDGTVLPIWDKDGNGLIWYKSTLNTEDGYANYDYVSSTQTDSTTKPYVSYSKGGPYSRSVDGKGYQGYQVSGISVTDDNGTYSSSSDKSHEDFVLVNIQGLMFNSNNKVNMFAATFKNCASLEAAYLDAGSESAPIFILGNSFNGCSKLSYVNMSDIYLLEIGGDGAFNGCSSLTEINLPNTIKALGNYPFQGTGITEFTFPSSIKTISGSATFKSCASLKKVYGLEELIERGVITGILGSMFEKCTSLENLFENGVFPEGITSIGNSAFYGCTSLGPNVILPNTCTTIGQTSFIDCTSIEKVVLGATFTTWSSYDGFKNCSNLKEVWMPETMTAIAGNVFNSAASDCVFYFTGTKDQLDNVKANTNSNNTAFNNAYNQAISWDAFQALETKSGRYIVYDVNKCLAFYNKKHTVTNGNCMVDDICKICSDPLTAQATHDTVQTLVYESFLANGVYTCDCIFNGCTIVDVAEGDEGSVASPLFGGGEGFSTKGEDGIAGGYTINVEAVDKYKKINGSLTIGVMVVNPDYLDGKSSFFDSKGKINTDGGALQVNFTNNQYENVSVSIQGFTGVAENLSLVIALYAYDEVENVEFIQSSTTACGDKNVKIGETTLYTVTLASVKAGSSDLSSLGDYVMPSQKEQE